MPSSRTGGIFGGYANPPCGLVGHCLQQFSSKEQHSLVPRLSERGGEEEVGESLVSTASGSDCVTTHEDKI